MIGRGTIARRLSASAAPGRRSTLSIATVALLLALAGALAARPAQGAGESPVSVGVTNLPITFNASFSPKALSPTKPTPAVLVLEGGPRFYSPPTDLAAVGVRSLELELDRRIGLDAAALPLGARLATGTARVLVAGPGEPPALVPVDGQLAVYNRGARPGGAVMRLVLSLPAPIGETVASPLVIRDVPRGTGGRFGSRAMVAIPRLDGGAAALVHFALRFAESVPSGAGAVPVFTATCTDGKIVIAAREELGAGYASEGEVVRACSPKP
jgi:hypothetical protein